LGSAAIPEETIESKREPAHEHSIAKDLDILPVHPKLADHID
jgi:hypothetical protein